MAEKEKSIGGLWANKAKDGGTYFNGYLEVNGEKIPFIAFYNNYKKEAKQPDYQIYPKKETAPKEQPQRTEAEQRAPLNEIKSEVHTDEISPDDIPF